MATKTRFASSTPSSKEQFSLGSYFRRAWNFLQRENLNRLLLFTTIIILISTVAISLVEPEMTVVNGLWWSIVTMTTVGYGDISPHSLGGSGSTRLTCCGRR